MSTEKSTVANTGATVQETSATDSVTEPVSPTATIKFGAAHPSPNCIPHPDHSHQPDPVTATTYSKEVPASKSAEPVKTPS